MVAPERFPERREREGSLIDLIHDLQSDQGAKQAQERGRVCAGLSCEPVDVLWAVRKHVGEVQPGEHADALHCGNVPQRVSKPRVVVDGRNSSRGLPSGT